MLKSLGFEQVFNLQVKNFGKPATFSHESEKVPFTHTVSPLRRLTASAEFGRPTPYATGFLRMSTRCELAPSSSGRSQQASW